MNNLVLNNVNVAPVVGIMPDTPYNRIISFLDGYESKNTRNNYLRHFKLMFMFMTGKQLEQLTYNDIKNIDDIKVENFRTHLKTQYKATTINTVIASCKALFDKFKERRIIEINDFDINPLIQKDNSHGSLTNKEIHGLFDYCLKYDYKPETLKLYYEFLFRVTCRKEAAQSLKWDQIQRELDIETSNLIYVVTFMDKGKEVKKGITDDFYNRLLNNYNKEKGFNNKVFLGINNITYDKVLKGFCKEWGIGEERRICQHSIKSTGLDFIMATTGDHNIVALAGQHINFNTSYKKYTNKNRKFSEHPSYFLDKDYGIDMLKGLGRDELIQLIESAGRETIIKLCLEMEKGGSKK